MGMSAYRLAKYLKNAHYLNSKSELIKKVKEYSKNKINIVFIGAGDMEEKVKSILT